MGRSSLSMRGINGLRSNPTDSARPSLSSDHANSPIPVREPVNGYKSTVSRNGHPVARSAKIEKENTRDFADFIRSTGPVVEQKYVPKNPASRPTTASRPLTAVQTSPSAAQQSASPRRIGKTTNGLTPIIASKETGQKFSRGPQPRLQAREAKLSRSDQSSDLIDFIRQGPPVDRADGNRRIPRTVAPFRRTMDSDEIHDMGHGRSKDVGTPNSVTSTQGSLVLSKSIHSSANSRTGLLDSTNRKNVQEPPSRSNVRSPPGLDDPPHLVRKQRRVRDPYAIDSDSEEDVDGSTPKPQREEESLMDFLRSMQAPSQGPSINTPNEAPKTNGRTLQRKSSGPSIRSRFARSGSTSIGTKASPAKSPSQPLTISPSNRSRSDAPQIPPLNEASPPLMASIGASTDTYQSRMTNSARMDRDRTVSGPKTIRPLARPQVRLEHEEIGSSRDLADFLRSSGPPEPVQSHQPSTTKEEGGFARMFSRRKKSSVG